MKNRLLCLCLSLMLLILPVASHASMLQALSAAQPGSEEAASVLESRVLDEAGLLSLTEKVEIAERILTFQQLTGMDFVLLTTSEGIGDASSDTYVEDFYANGGYGLDDNSSGLAYFINMKDSYHHLTTNGRMTECMTDERLEYVIDAGTALLSDSQYADAVLEMIRMTETFYLQDYQNATSLPEPTDAPAGNGTAPAVNNAPLSNIPSAATILLFLTSIVSTVISVLTQF